MLHGPNDGHDYKLRKHAIVLPAGKMGIYYDLIC